MARVKTRRGQHRHTPAKIPPPPAGRPAWHWRWTGTAWSAWNNDVLLFINLLARRGTDSEVTAIRDKVRELSREA